MAEKTPGVNGRVYPRKFNWDEAKLLRARGWTYADIARRLGVSDSAVQRVCDPHRYLADRDVSERWQRQGVCMDCGGPCSRHTSGAARKVKRCRDCASETRITSVREDALWCSSCREWKPDSEFSASRIEECEHRRFRHDNCRACSVAYRQAYRVRGRVPCEGGCGRLVEGKGRTTRFGADPNRPFLCLSCWHVRRRAA